MSERFDAIVIGASAGGLTAAMHLARAGLRTVVLEQSDAVPLALPHPLLRGLDAALVDELRLTGIGAWYAVPNLATLLTSPIAPPLALGDVRGGTWLRPREAEALRAAQRELVALGWALAPVWRDGRPFANAAAQLRLAHRTAVEEFSMTSAFDWLSARLQSPALVSMLASDVAFLGAAPTEPGSALTLAWSESQPIALASPELPHALAQAAQLAGVETRTQARVRELLIAQSSVRGVHLSSGAELEAPLVVSAVSRAQTFTQLLPPPHRGLGTEIAPSPLRLLTATLRLPSRSASRALARYRVVSVGKPADMVTGYARAQLGAMPDELCTELVLAPVASGMLQPVVRAWPLPGNAQPEATASRLRHALAESIGDVAIAAATLELRAKETATARRILASVRERLATPLPGFLFCGEEAEPVNLFSGRAPRQAAQLAVAYLKGRVS